MIISLIIVLAVNILTPYLWYEKLSSTCIKYVFVMEEFGYLTNKESKALRDELIKQGFSNDKLNIEYTSSRVLYGEPIFLKISYDYPLELPFSEQEKIPMVVKRESVSKR